MRKVWKIRKQENKRFRGKFEENTTKSSNKCTSAESASLWNKPLKTSNQNFHNCPIISPNFANATHIIKVIQWFIVYVFASDENLKL